MGILKNKKMIYLSFDVATEDSNNEDDNMELYQVNEEPQGN